MKGLGVTKVVNEIKFQDVWGELEEKQCFQRQSFTKYLRKALVSMWNSKIRETFNFYFSAVFCWYQQSFYFEKWPGHWEEDWALDYNSMNFWDFPDLSEFPKILSLKSWGKSWGNSSIPYLLLKIALCFNCGETKILLKNQKVSKYYENDWKF